VDMVEVVEDMVVGAAAAEVVVVVSLMTVTIVDDLDIWHEIVVVVEDQEEDVVEDLEEAVEGVVGIVVEVEVEAEALMGEEIVTLVDVRGREAMNAAMIAVHQHSVVVSCC